MNVVETIQEVFNPRLDDNLTKMIFTGRKHQHLGDKHDMEFNGDYNDRQDFITKGEIEVRKHFKDVAICKAVHLYEHGGIAISTKMQGQFADKWDSGTIGFVIITKADLKKEYGVKKITQDILSKADSVLEAEIDAINQYIQ